ncbi:MAG: hypothetical protein R6U32_07855 [Candidatus Woesearchaeota archaeon]
MWPFDRLKKPKQGRKFRKNIKSLEKNIDKLARKGYSRNDIVEKLTGAGWGRHVVELVMHEAHKPNSSIDQLNEYVRQQKLAGRHPEEIKETLIEAGWSEEVVDVALGL